MAISLIFAVESVIETIQSITQQLLTLVNNRDALRLLFDIFNIDFREGPFGVKCWINFVINAYGNEQQLMFYS